MAKGSWHNFLWLQSHVDFILGCITVSVTEEAGLRRQALNEAQLGMLGMIAFGVGRWTNPEALAVLEDLRAKGLARIAGTGRPGSPKTWIPTAKGRTRLDEEVTP